MSEAVGIGTGSAILAKLAGGAASAAIRSQRGKVNWNAVASDVVSSTLGSALAEAITDSQGAERLEQNRQNQFKLSTQNPALTDEGRGLNLSRLVESDFAPLAHRNDSLGFGVRSGFGIGPNANERLFDAPIPNPFADGESRYVSLTELAGPISAVRGALLPGRAGSAASIAGLPLLASTPRLTCLTPRPPRWETVTDC